MSRSAAISPVIAAVVGIVVGLIVGGIIGFFGGAAAPTVTTVTTTVTQPGMTVTTTVTQPGAVTTVTQTVTQTVRQTVTRTVTAPGELRPVTLTIAAPRWWSAFSFWRDIWVPFFQGRAAQLGLVVNVEFAEYPSPDPQYNNKLITDLKAGVAPDVVFVDAFFIGQFAEAGFLVDLTDRVNAWPDWQQYYKAMKDMVSWKGRVYALPYETDIRPLYYRRDILEAAGVIAPGEDWQPRSWDEILEAARKIRQNLPTFEGKEVRPIAIEMGSKIEEATPMQGFYMLLMGTWPPYNHIFDFEQGKFIARSPQLKRAFEFLYTIYVKEPELAVPAEVWFGASPIDEVHAMFIGKHPEIITAMLITWQGVWFDMANPEHKWYFPERDQKVGVAKMPGSGDPGSPEFITVSGGWSVAISANAKDVDLAWEFLKAVFSKEMTVQRMIAFPGGLPPRKDVVEDPLFKARMDPYTLWAAELLPFTTFRPSHPDYPKYSSLIQQATDRILNGEDPDSVLNWFAEQVKRITDDWIEVPG